MPTLIPTQKTARKQRLQDYIVLLYGAPKIGKTTFSSHVDAALFVATEAGHNAHELFRVPIDTWKSFLQLCSDLETDKHPHKTVVIDTVDGLYRCCTQFILDKLGVVHQSDAAYGKAYAMIEIELTRVLTKLAQRMGLWMISHAMDREIELKDGRKYVRSEPSLPAGACKAVVTLADIVLYAYPHEEKDERGQTVIRRVVRTKPSQTVIAGDRTGRLPDQLPLDYNEFVKAFQNERGET